MRNAYFYNPGIGILNLHWTVNLKKCVHVKIFKNIVHKIKSMQQFIHIRFKIKVRRWKINLNNLVIKTQFIIKLYCNVKGSIRIKFLPILSALGNYKVTAFSLMSMIWARFNKWTIFTNKAILEKRHICFIVQGIIN